MAFKKQRWVHKPCATTWSF